MLAIFTNSYDATSDLIIGHIPKNVSVFRFNSDLLADYSIIWKPGNWQITNLVTSDCLTSSSLTTAYWRKPLEMIAETIPGYHEPFYASEIRYAFREIINSIIRSHKFRLVEPFAERRVGKFYQLESAARYFNTPDTLYAFNANYSTDLCKLPVNNGVVAKSISGAQVSEQNVMYTSKVDLSSIDFSKPWYLQCLINADQDVTCAFVKGKCYWARRSRNTMGNIIDVRESQVAGEWENYDAKQQQDSRVISLMDDLELDFGRIDFLESNGELIFLEVNPNGQYAWLDIDNQHGLIGRVIDEIL